ncbi:MAG TPA: ABC transporter substrate-binding protein [Chloroflexota bacterium]|nr:ABC transporter substrate-binding protein [Chloroflexota bacterium]
MARYRATLLATAYLALSLVGLACGAPSAAPASTAAAPAGSPPAAPSGAPAAVPASNAAAAGGAAAAAQPAPPAPVATVKLAYLPLLTHGSFMVAFEKGYWRELGLEVEGTQFGGSDQAMPFLANGQIDVAGGSAGAGFLNALSQGVTSRMVATLGGVRPDGLSGAALMVRKDNYDSGLYTKPADLRGKRVAVNGKGVYGEWLADRHLRLGGLTLDDVDMVILGIPDMLAGLQGGSVDAADLIEPTVAQATERGIAVSIAREGADPNGQSQVLLYGEQFIRDNPEGARRFMVGYLRALRELARSEFKDPSDVEIISQYTKIPADLVMRAVPSYVDPNGRINVAHLEQQQQFFADRGYLNYREPLDLNQYVDYTWLDAALQQLGPYQP